jgi:hypothetical protein
VKLVSFGGAFFYFAWRKRGGGERGVVDGTYSFHVGLGYWCRNYDISSIQASETYLKNSPRILLYVENTFCRDLMTCTVIATASNFADSAIVLVRYPRDWLKFGPLFCKSQPIIM